MQTRLNRGRTRRARRRPVRVWHDDAGSLVAALARSNGFSGATARIRTEMGATPPLWPWGGRGPKRPGTLQARWCGLRFFWAGQCAAAAPPKIRASALWDGRRVAHTQASSTASTDGPSQASSFFWGRCKRDVCRSMRGFEVIGGGRCGWLYGKVGQSRSKSNSQSKCVWWVCPPRGRPTTYRRTYTGEDDGADLCTDVVRLDNAQDMHESKRAMANVY